MTLDNLMGRTFDERNYNCAHYALDVWEALTGSRLHEQFQAVLTGPGLRSVAPELTRGFKEVSQPAEPSFVLMRRHDGAPHLGVWTKGRVFHMRESGPHGAIVGQLIREYRQLRFYACEN